VIANGNYNLISTVSEGKYWRPRQYCLGTGAVSNFKNAFIDRAFFLFCADEIRSQTPPTVPATAVIARGGKTPKSEFPALKIAIAIIPPPRSIDPETNC